MEENVQLILNTTQFKTLTEFLGIDISTLKNNSHELIKKFLESLNLSQLKKILYFIKSNIKKEMAIRFTGLKEELVERIFTLLYKKNENVENTLSPFELNERFNSKEVELEKLGIDLGVFNLYRDPFYEIIETLAIIQVHSSSFRMQQTIQIDSKKLKELKKADPFNTSLKREIHLRFLTKEEEKILTAENKVILNSQLVDLNQIKKPRKNIKKPLLISPLRNLLSLFKESNKIEFSNPDKLDGFLLFCVVKPLTPSQLLDNIPSNLSPLFKNFENQSDKIINQKEIAKGGKKNPSQNIKSSEEEINKEEKSFAFSSSNRINLSIYLGEETLKSIRSLLEEKKPSSTPTNLIAPTLATLPSSVHLLSQNIPNNFSFSSVNLSSDLFSAINNSPPSLASSSSNPVTQEEVFVLSSKNKKEKEREEEEEEILDLKVKEVGFSVSLFCPLSFERIKFPGRSFLCKHVQCFDIYQFILYAKERQTWNCLISF